MKHVKGHHHKDDPEKHNNYEVISESDEEVETLHYKKDSLKFEVDVKYHRELFRLREHAL